MTINDDDPGVDTIADVVFFSPEVGLISPLQYASSDSSQQLDSLLQDRDLSIQHPALLFSPKLLLLLRVYWFYAVGGVCMPTSG